MKPSNFLLKDTLLFVAALVLGMSVNMGLIYAGIYLIPLPAGVDVTTRNGLQAALPLMGYEHFIFPFLAHALGTLVAAFAVTRWVSNRKQRRAYLIAAIFFIGGLINIIGMPSPLWFSIADLLLAYFPMAWLGSRINFKK
jgi:hypothetical protein